MSSRSRVAVALVASAVALLSWNATAAADESEQSPQEQAEEQVLDQAVTAPPEVGPVEKRGVPRFDNRPISWRWALGGQAFGLTGGTIWYVLDEETKAVDWDYTGWYSDDPELELRPQSEVWKGLDGFRFDDNVMVLNTPLHPLAGSGYYLLARSSSMGMLASFLTANTTSFLWEAVIEHQEVISVNDQIYTGIGGFPLGEFYYQMGQYFRHSEPTRFNRAMSWVFGLPLQLRDLVHGTSPQRGGLTDRGFPEDIWAKFVLHTGAGAGLTADGYGEVGASGELIRLPDFQAEGEHSKWVFGPLQSSLATSLSLNNDYVHNWKIDAQVDMAGYYHHDISDSGGHLEGTSLFVGTGMGFRHVQHWYQEEPLADGDFLSRYGIVHLPGLRLDGSWLSEHADVRLSYSALPGITSIDSVAYPVYRDETGREAARTVLADERYYYGWGISNLLRLEVDMDPAHFHLNADIHWSRSINALDRFKHEEERFGEDGDGYLTLTDLVSELELGVLFALPVSNLRAGAIAQARRHNGTLTDATDDEWSADRRDVRALGTIQLVY